MDMPAVFAGHGSPMNLVERNAFVKALEKLSKELPKPKAVLVVSAHWTTRGCFACSAERPKTIHDFYGFPEKLYGIEYPAKGDAELAIEMAAKLARFGAAATPSWGLDHGAWSILRKLFPDADVPAFQLSLDYAQEAPANKPFEWHFEIGRELRSLRSKGVMILGSGNIVHNLQMADYENGDAEPFAWAVDFDAQAGKALERGDDDALLRPERLDGFAEAVPSWEHYLPLLYVLGAKKPGEKASFPFEGFQNASISMRCARFG